jgi:hypothetical protein
MNEPSKEIDRRRPVWLALSDLFLDTELQDSNHQYIARILAESGYADEELESILYREVFPVCIGNLMSLAGEWAGFPLEWLEERILRNRGDETPTPPGFVDKFGLSLIGIGSDWKKVLALLPEARHISGNPFRPYPSPPSWPSTVVQLAESLYAGEDCAFALHDALLEAGHAELAEHFREERSHPKGCWVVDLILGKK